MLFASINNRCFPSYIHIYNVYPAFNEIIYRYSH